MNHYVLSARLYEKAALRYTPAGIPVLQCGLEYQGQVEESGQQRQLELFIEAVALGETSDIVGQLALGQEAQFTGFLAAKRRNSKSLVFHITGCCTPPVGAQQPKQI